MSSNFFFSSINLLFFLFFPNVSLYPKLFKKTLINNIKVLRAFIKYPTGKGVEYVGVEYVARAVFKKCLALLLLKKHRKSTE